MIQSNSDIIFGFIKFLNTISSATDRQTPPKMSDSIITFVAATLAVAVNYTGATCWKLNYSRIFWVKKAAHWNSVTWPAFWFRIGIITNASRFYIELLPVWDILRFWMKEIKLLAVNRPFCNNYASWRSRISRIRDSRRSFIRRWPLAHFEMKPIDFYCKKKWIARYYWISWILKWTSFSSNFVEKGHFFAMQTVSHYTGHMPDFDLLIHLILLIYWF